MAHIPQALPVLQKSYTTSPTVEVWPTFAKEFRCFHRACPCLPMLQKSYTTCTSQVRMAHIFEGPSHPFIVPSHAFIKNFQRIFPCFHAVIVLAGLLKKLLLLDSRPLPLPLPPFLVGPLEKSWKNCTYLTRKKYGLVVLPDLLSKGSYIYIVNSTQNCPCHRQHVKWNLINNLI